MAEDNHYLPIFYLKRWAGEDGHVCVYSRPHKISHVIRKSPKGIGYQRDLYTVVDVDGPVSNYLERQFFQATDAAAALALKVVEAGQWQPMDTIIRSAWTRFIISLLHRNPEQVAKFHEIVSRYMEIVKPQYNEYFRNRSAPDTPQTFEEFWRATRPEIIGRTWIDLIQRVIDSVTVGTHFNRLIWRVIEFQSSRTLLTGDRPIIMTNGMDKPNSHLAIPIGPHKLFLAAHTIELANAITRDKADNVIDFVNDKIVRQARRFCIGTDDTQVKFFGDRFGAMEPSSPVETVPLPTAEELRRLALRTPETDAGND